MNKLGSGTLVLLIIVASAVLIPFNTTIAPEWRVQVVNENGKPYQNQLVRQRCRNYTLDIMLCPGGYADQRTDENGYVVFPERKIRMNLLFRVTNSVIMVFVYMLGHGSLGTKVSVNSSGPVDTNPLEYTPGEPLPDKLVLPSKPKTPE